MTTQWNLIEGHLILLINMSSILGQSVPVGLIGQICPVQLPGLNSPWCHWVSQGKDVPDDTLHRKAKVMKQPSPSQQIYCLFMVRDDLFD